MNRISTFLVIAAIVFIIYYFRETIHAMLAKSPTVIQNPAPKTGCNCPQTQPNQPANTVVDNNPGLDEMSTDDEIDLQEILTPNAGDYSTGSFAYSLNGNSIY